MSEINMKVDTGLVTVVIGDDTEKLGSFRFNPTDIDLIRRYDKVEKELNTMELPEDASYEDILALSDKIKELFDFLLNYKVSADIFRYANPFSTVNDGDLYFHHVLNGISDIIETQIKERAIKREEKINKALAKYK